MNKIVELLGIQYPIFQGAMAQISRHELVSAVSNAGGLGILASGGMTREELRYEIRECKKLTDKPFAVNLMLMMPNIDQKIDVLIEEDVRIITTGAGTPKPYMEKLKSEGFIVMPVIPSVSVAQKMEALGVDAVIVEGTEAGGHIGESTTMSLLPQVVDAVSIPVIAAGGIADSRGILASLALGACGVQIGTLFLTAEECPISEEYKNAVLAAKDNTTVVTGRTNRAPVRCLRNEMTDHFLQMEFEQVDREELEKLTIGSLAKAVYEGDIVEGTMMAGQVAGMIQEIKPVHQIMEELMTGIRPKLNALSEAVESL